MNRKLYFRYHSVSWSNLYFFRVLRMRLCNFLVFSFSFLLIFRGNEFWGDHFPLHLHFDFLNENVFGARYSTVLKCTATSKFLASSLLHIFLHILLTTALLNFLPFNFQTENSVNGLFSKSIQMAVIFHYIIPTYVYTDLNRHTFVLIFGKRMSLMNCTKILISHTKKLSWFVREWEGGAGSNLSYFLELF